MKAMTTGKLEDKEISVEAALALKGSGNSFDFRCMECGEGVRPQKSGGHVQAHFEHLKRNPVCSVSHVAGAAYGNGWTDEELRACVAAYLAMLDQSRAGVPIVKRQVYAALAAQFERTSKSFEYRMQNISYVFSLLGRPWVPGLRPATNVGANVAKRIESLIAELEGRPTLPIVAFEIEVGKAMKGLGSEPPVGKKVPATKSAVVAQYDRDPAVKAWVLKQAKGVCECCAQSAPFQSASGPFLEVHHVRLLADGGSDTTTNAIALCPNCHRRLHYSIDAAAKIEWLYNAVERLIREDHAA